MSGDEVDAFTRWRHYLNWKPGQRKRIKRGYNRRERQMVKQEIGREVSRLHHLGQ